MDAAADTLQISFRAEDLPIVAERLWQWGHKATVWAFYGGLGAGKTTTIRALCRHLGVDDAVSSPTFALMNEYRLPDGLPLYHMDWYRVADAEEATAAGMEDALTSGHRCLVEWPGRAESLLPHAHLRISLEMLSETERTLTAQLVRS